VVDRILPAMCNAGLDVWIDRQNIQAGNSWRVQIVQAIDTCDAFVLMLSPNSAASDNVRKEIDLAQDSGRTIFVLMLEPVKLPPEIHYQLAGLQFLDLQSLGFDQAVGQLISAVKTHLTRLRPAEAQMFHQVELVIQGVDLKSFSAEKCDQLLNFVAQLANANRSSLTIASMAAGSVHVFMDMPAETAFLLKTLALNRDKRFKRLKIISLRLAGDRKFINIALGVLTAAGTIGLLQAIWLSIPSLFMPVIGVAAGKVLTITLAVGLTIGLAVSAPALIAPLLSASATPTATSVSLLMPDPQSAPKPTLAIVPTKPRQPSTPVISTMGESIQVQSLTESPTSTSTLSSTAPPYIVSVLDKDVACYLGPHPDYGNAHKILHNSEVEVIGRGCISDCSFECTGDWLIVKHPQLPNVLCWVEPQYLAPAVDVRNLESFCPRYVKPPAPTRTRVSVSLTDPPNRCTDPYVDSADAYCYCYFHPADPGFCPLTGTAAP
jgi:hypothetical protein